ncbi:hypothetical protein H0H87_012304, partial [Tephrocybe sp. NHM501043]
PWSQDVLRTQAAFAQRAPPAPPTVPTPIPIPIPIPQTRAPPEPSHILVRPPHTVTPPRGPRANRFPTRTAFQSQSHSPAPPATIPSHAPLVGRAPPTGPRSLRLRGDGGYQHQHQHQRFHQQRSDIGGAGLKGRLTSGREESMGPEEHEKQMGGRWWGQPLPRGPSTDRDRDDRERERERERRGTGGGGGIGTRWGR